MQCNLLLNPRGEFLDLEAGEFWKTTKIFKKLEKKRVLSTKMLIFVIIKIENYFMGKINFSVTYYQTPEEVSRLLVLKSLIDDNYFKKC